MVTIGMSLPDSTPASESTSLHDSSDHPLPADEAVVVDASISVIYDGASINSDLHHAQPKYIAMAEFNLICYNLHGFNQFCEALEELFVNFDPACLLLQEHWLTSDSMSKLDRYSDYFVIGSPALRKSVELGPIYGRPAGGLAALIHRRFVAHCQLNETADRCIAAVVGDLLIFNVYAPLRRAKEQQTD
jgi:hypothetical protein